MRSLAVVAVWVASPVIAATTMLQGQAVSVATGDTLTVAVDGKAMEIRLADIGAPTGSEYFAPSARALLDAIVAGKDVRIEATAITDDGRAVGRVSVGELDVTLELVRRGAAWVCWEYAADSRLLPYENDARCFRRGLWPSTWEIDARAACRRRPPLLRPDIKP